MLEELALGRAKSDDQRAQLAARADELARQQTELVQALSTPVIRVWPGVLALPLIGRVDEQRAELISHTLLERVAAEGATHVVLDLTGVADVSAATIAGLLRLVRAVGLLGATCLVSGVRPQVARQIVELGETGETGETGESRSPVQSSPRLADALALVLREKGALRR